MMKYFSQTNAMIGAGVAVLLVLGWYAREEFIPIFRFIEREKNEEQMEAGTPEEKPQNVDAQKDATAADAGGKEGPALFLPPYTGREPGEVRPNEEALKNTPEERRQALYRAIQKYGAEIKNDPARGDWVSLGLFKKNIGDYEGAADAWEYASILFPGEDTPLFNLGELYRHYIPDYPKSERFFRAAIAKELANASRAYISLSDLYYYSYTEKRDQADNVLVEAIGVYPRDMNLVRALAALFERMGDKKQAILWWEKVLQEEPENAFVKDSIRALKESQ